MVGTWWVGEIRSCSCLAVLPDPAWVLLNKIYQPFFTSLYIISLSQEFVHHANRMTAGDPMAEDTTVGATITAAHADKVLGFIERAKKEGARVECGGERLKMEGELKGGHFLSPCILTNCR